MSRIDKQPATMWSRRRAAVLAETESETKATQRAEDARAQAEMARKSDADILQELDLKDPDQLQQGDDFASFMSVEVPDRLRKRALRTLWRSNPVLACVDDLVDYGDDFKAEWDNADLIQTVYRVGKGMLNDEELAAQNGEVTEFSENEDQQDEVEPETPETKSEALPVAMNDAEPLDEPEERQITPDLPVSATPRRMRFEFDEVT